MATRPEAADAGVVTAAVAPLRAYPENAEAAKSGYRALAELAPTHANRQPTADAGGVEAVVAALRAQNAGTQIGVFCAPFDVAARDAASQRRVAEAGGTKAIVAALRANPANAEAQRSGRFAALGLVNVACSHDASGVVDVGGIEAVLAGLRA